MKLLASIVSTAIVVSYGSIGNVDAACGSNVPLCNNAPQVLETNLCTEQDIKWSMDSCCSKESLESNQCLKNPEPTCRTIELKTPFTDSTNACCAEMALTFDWSRTSKSCCKSCSCFGDPHCISFDEKVDTWIIYDGRTTNPNAVYGKELFCPIKEVACKNQLDHAGKNCVYKENGKGTVGPDGSPCQSASPNPAEILMFKAKDIELILYLGDRGIIESIKLTNGNETYYTKSGPCATQNMPWRDSPNGAKPPTDPNWLPNKWSFSPVNLGQHWSISGLASGIEIEMRCIFNRDGLVPRINIDSLADPSSNRPGTSGVCATGVIDKQLSSYQHTEDIKKFCRSSQSQGQAIEYFCGIDMINSPAACIKKFCEKISTTEAEKKACAQDVVKYQKDKEFQDGWERIWCAYNTLVSKNPAECVRGECLQCMYDVYDFTWGEAVKRWKGFSSGIEDNGGSGECIPLNELNSTLSDCQNGITLQYLDTGSIDENGDLTTCWVDFLAVPEGRNICGGNSIFLSSLAGSKSKDLFDKKIRIKQCNNKALCKTQSNSCTPEFGVSGSIKLIPDPVTNKANLYWHLVREGKLVCSQSDPNCLTKAYGSQTEEAKCSGCQYCPTK